MLLLLTIDSCDANTIWCTLRISDSTVRVRVRVRVRVVARVRFRFELIKTSKHNRVIIIGLCCVVARLTLTLTHGKLLLTLTLNVFLAR